MRTIIVRRPDGTPAFVPVFNAQKHPELCAPFFPNRKIVHSLDEIKNLVNSYKI